MKKRKIYGGVLGLAGLAALIVAADHIDAPSAAGTTADIADFYAFEPNEGSSNTVFVVDLQSNVLPDLAYGSFDEEVMTEINIDLDGDLVEDRVIQAIPRSGIMYFFLSDVPTTGTSSSIDTDNPIGSVAISGASATVETTSDGIRLFAGPRQDPFYFDFFQFNAVIGGMAPEGFLPPDEATDTFDGANTMSIAIEIPNSMLGTPTGQNALGVPVYKTWVTTNRKS